MLRKGSSLESASSSQLGCEDGNGFPEITTTLIYFKNNRCA